MRYLKKPVVKLTLLLTMIFIFTVIGMTGFSNTQETSAYLSHDEIDLCTLTHTYIEGEYAGTVDITGFMICCHYMDAD